MVMWKIAFMIMPAIPFAAWCVALLTAVRPLRMGRAASLFMALALAAAFAKFVFFAIAGGNSFNPDLPQIAIRAYGGAYAIAMIFTMFAASAAAIDGVLRLCRHPVHLRTKRIRTAILAGLASATALWGMYEGLCIPSVRRVEIAYRDLPPAFDGYRIVHLSDLHCSTAARRRRFEQIVGRVNALDADLIAITGDFVDGSVQDRCDDLAPLAGLRARDGVVCCTGNHEVYSGWESWRPVFHGWGFDFPEESGVRLIRRGGHVLAVGGLPDPMFNGWGMSVESVGPASDAFAGAPDGAFRILLFHRPFTAAVNAAEADVRLQLSGHTHGGAMPLIDRLVAYTNEGRTRGLYGFADDRFIHVSPGTGQWAGFPLRLFNPAEISEIVLRADPGRR